MTQYELDSLTLSSAAFVSGMPSESLGGKNPPSCLHNTCKYIQEADFSTTQRMLTENAHRECSHIVYMEEETAGLPGC